MSAVPGTLIEKINSAFRACGVVPQSIGVAVSGGSDSAMLAVAAAEHARSSGLDLHLFHIHHGLQQSADEWAHRVHDLAHQLAVPCHSRRVLIDSQTGKGIEAAAREARYTALCDLAKKVGVRVILLGHHQHDQAETVLLRLLRGAGPEGLAAMANRTEREGIVYLRPWLTVDRTDILRVAQQYAVQTGWQFVIDPTNTDDRYARAAVRTRLAPVLDQRWPGWRDRLVRHAAQAAQTCEVLEEVAHADLQRLDFHEDNRSFSLRMWRELSAARQALVLRYWLDLHGLPMPTQSRLDDLMRQLRQVHALGFDRALSVRHAGSIIVCARGRVSVIDRSDATL